MQYFSEQLIGDLKRERERVEQRYEDLTQRYVWRQYRSDRAREYAQHGFPRRLSDLVHVIGMVYRALPPELDVVPERDKILDATIAIQSFVVNVFGCLDNLAWIYVLEKDVRNSKGERLAPRQVTLSSDPVRAAFSEEFRNHLDGRKEWFQAIKEFRDGLAHRIPLYIPPFTISPKDRDRYDALEREASEAWKRHDSDGYRRVQAEQQRIGRFQPLIAHSLYEEGAKPIIFHPQLIVDYNTVDEFGRKILDELDR